MGMWLLQYISVRFFTLPPSKDKELWKFSTLKIACKDLYLRYRPEMVWLFMIGGEINETSWNALETLVLMYYVLWFVHIDDNKSVGLRYTELQFLPVAKYKSFLEQKRDEQIKERRQLLVRIMEDPDQYDTKSQVDTFFNYGKLQEWVEKKEEGEETQTSSWREGLRDGIKRGLKIFT